jgi:vanillate O-demethylase ferredoxin subunit
MQKPIAWRPGIVRATRDLTHDIRMIEIAPTGAFVAPSPGGHIKISVMIGERPDTRSYSIVGPCADGVYRVAVKLLKDTRGGSAYMWALGPGARVSIAGPDNHFGLSIGRPDYLLLAGGIGVTPIFTHALALARSQAPFRMLYAARGRRDLALADQLREEIGDRLEVFVGEEGARVDLAAEIAKLASGGEFYVCGPIGLLEAAKRAWRDAGRPFDLLRFETFGNSGSWPSVPFRIKLPRLAKDIFVPAGKSMLDALEDAGVSMIYDCRKGECGLCALPILETDGVVDHRDVFFSEEEKAANAKLCTCVSRVYGASITLDTADR